MQGADESSNSLLWRVMYHWINVFGQKDGMLKRAELFWTRVRGLPSEEKISELVLLLKKLEQAGFSVEPSDNFLLDLEKLPTHNNEKGATKIGATGSPLKLPLWN